MCDNKTYMLFLSVAMEEIFIHQVIYGTANDQHMLAVQA